MKRTYIDANLLIEAFRGTSPGAEKALRVLDDPERRLVVSDYVRLEVLPKPTFLKRQEEVEFMETVLENAEAINTSPELTGLAIAMASKYDMTPIDALHIGAAAVADVDEFVTMEKPTKPICQVKEVNVISMRSESKASL